MKFNLTNILMYYILMMGVLLSISSNNWMMMWSGLEISLMSFIPLMSGGMIGSESSMKYFIIQSISSTLLILSILMMITTKFEYKFIMMISLMLKMGVAPFHNWVLSIINSLEYKLLFMLLSIMKIAPLVMMSYLNYCNDFIIMLSLIIGSIFSLNQNSIRKLLVYSSIYNMAYILSTININYIWTMYITVYSTILLLLVLMMNKMKINYFNQFMMNDFSFLFKMNLWISLLSLGGMPPLLGFLPKLIIMEMMILKKSFILILMMILSSLIVMFFYMRMVFLAFMNYSIMNKKSLNFSKLSIWSLMINTNMFPFLISLKYLY
uniref:NADH-ubiquinone oxidoreductase chain 2 n=1 Tax=Mileewa amplimacula TaxID=2545674 RepID=A0A977TM25_9HEMI|nr:NADH dehydrogenase subunit 2 [Mileewa amplimacula]UXX17566.1 NADH dehydrogenase subunit 2 [Mileewa amplimacula]